MENQPPLRTVNETQAKTRDFQFFLESQMVKTLEALKDCSDADRNMQAKYTADATRDLENIRTGENAAQAMRNQSIENKQTLQQREAELTLVEGKLKELRNEVDQWEVQRSALDVDLDKAVLSNTQRQKELQLLVDSKEEDHSALVQTYSDLLGLQLCKPENGDSGILCIFTDIDTETPSRKFTFCLNYSPSGFIVEGCKPLVEDLAEVINEIDQTGDLGKFFVSMYMRFREVATREALARLKI